MVCLFFVVMQSGRLLFSAHDSSVKKVHFVSNFILSQYVGHADPLDFFLFLTLYKVKNSSKAVPLRLYNFFNCNMEKISIIRVK